MRLHELQFNQILASKHPVNIKTNRRTTLFRMVKGKTRVDYLSWVDDELELFMRVALVTKGL